MAAIVSFASCLPPTVLGNAELAERLEVSADWIYEASGIRERRIAAQNETVVHMAVEAGRRCLATAGVAAGKIGMVIVSSGSGARRFPGPAAAVARELAKPGIPCLDLPVASAGSIFGMSLASRLVGEVGPILLIASETMSRFALREPLDKNTAILFGDGAGACLIVPGDGMLTVRHSVLHSDGSFENELYLDADGRLTMIGLSVIMQASRKIPCAISEVLAAGGMQADAMTAFLMHQANQNLIVRVAQKLNVPRERFYSNIATYGNTSSASMLIAAAEYFCRKPPQAGERFCFAGFGAGFHWGAVLAESCDSALIASD